MNDIAAPVRRITKTHFRPERLSRADVFGKHKFQNGRLLGREGGLVVARGGEICPVFKDQLPEKAVTIVGKEADYEEIVYWLEYVKGVGCTTKEHHQDGYVALRAEHQSPLPQRPARSVATPWRNPFVRDGY